VIKDNVLYKYKRSCDTYDTSTGTCYLEEISVDLSSKQIIQAVKYTNILANTNSFRTVNDNENIYFIYLGSNKIIHILKKPIGSNYFTAELALNLQQAGYSIGTITSIVRYVKITGNELILMLYGYNTATSIGNTLILRIDKNELTLNKAYSVETPGGVTPQPIERTDSQLIPIIVKKSITKTTDNAVFELYTALYDIVSDSFTSKIIRITTAPELYSYNPVIRLFGQQFTIYTSDSVGKHWHVFTSDLSYIKTYEHNNNIVFNIANLKGETATTFTDSSLLYVTDNEIFKENYNLKGYYEIQEYAGSVYVTVTDYNPVIEDITSTIQNYVNVYTYTQSESLAKYPVEDISQYYTVYPLNSADLALTDSVSIEYQPVFGS